MLQRQRDERAQNFQKSKVNKHMKGLRKAADFSAAFSLFYSFLHGINDVLNFLIGHTRTGRQTHTYLK